MSPPRPDASGYNPDPGYLRWLIYTAGVSQREAARLIGMSATGLQNYIRAPHDAKYRPAPYVVQFALECLAGTYTERVEMLELVMQQMSKPAGFR